MRHQGWGKASIMQTPRMGKGRECKDEQHMMALSRGSMGHTGSYIHCLQRHFVLTYPRYYRWHKDPEANSVFQP